MGIDYRAVVVVGLPRDQFIEVEHFLEWAEDKGLDICPVSYDSGDGIVGLVYAKSPDYWYSEFTYDPQRVAEMKQEFKDSTGMEAKVYLSSMGW